MMLGWFTTVPPAVFDFISLLPEVYISSPYKKKEFICYAKEEMTNERSLLKTLMHLKPSGDEVWLIAVNYFSYSSLRMLLRFNKDSID